MKKLLAIILLLIVSNTGFTQELGYLTGLSNVSVNNTKYYQPVYGISLSKDYKYIGIETNFLYFQALNQRIVQADYLKYSLQGKIGYFNKLSIYTGLNLAYNACIHHSSIQNHTNLSIAPIIGVSYKLINRTTVELKHMYDTGITNGYYYLDNRSKYKGSFILLGLKYNLTK